MPYKIQALFHIWFRFYLSQQLDRSDVIALLDYAEKLAHEISDKPLKSIGFEFAQGAYNPTTEKYDSGYPKYDVKKYSPANRALWEDFLSRCPKGDMSFCVYNRFFKGNAGFAYHYEVYLDYETDRSADICLNIVSVAINGDLLREKFGLTGVQRIAQGLVQWLQDRHIKLDYGLIAPVEVFKGSWFFNGSGAIGHNAYLPAPYGRRRFIYAYIDDKALPEKIYDEKTIVSMDIYTAAEFKMKERLNCNERPYGEYNPRAGIRDKVWTTFWGNIITYHQLGAPKRSKAAIQKIIAALAAAIAPNTITHIDEQTLFFTLPLDVTQFLSRRPRYRAACRQVNQVLKKYNIRMKLKKPFSLKDSSHVRDIPMYPDLNLRRAPKTYMLTNMDNNLPYFPNQVAICMQQEGLSKKEIAKRLFLSEANLLRVLQENKEKLAAQAADRKGKPSDNPST